MNFISTEMYGVFIIEPKLWRDQRGYFFESFRLDLFKKHIGDIQFVQENESMSARGVLRGFHYQLPPYVQSKLVYVMQGKVLDVAVDIRKGSVTFGKHMFVELTGENKRMLFIPRGFAHGFVVLSDYAVFSYKVDNYYSKEHERGIAYNDPFLNIEWGIDQSEIILSDKDKALPLLEHAELFDIR